MVLEAKLGEELICPVCGAIFEATDDTRYIIKGDYTCSWKCFLAESWKRAEMKRDKNKTK